jgi:hypothetical protein
MPRSQGDSESGEIRANPRGDQPVNADGHNHQEESQTTLKEEFIVAIPELRVEGAAGVVLGLRSHLELHGTQRL